MAILKKVVNTKDKDGNDLVLAVIVPSAQVRQKAQRVRAAAWAEAVKDGAIMREVLEKYLREQKIWDDARQAEYDRLRKKLLDAKLTLSGGGIRLKDAYALAIEVRRTREEITELLSQRNRVDANTADAYADQKHFEYMVAACTVYNDSKKPYFTVNGFDPDLNAYIEQANSQDENVAKPPYDAATAFSDLLYPQDDTAEENFETAFLKNNGFVDEKGRLVNKKGQLVDEKGRLVNENGRFVNEAGEYVDSEGNRVDEKGDFVVEFKPFLDDDDNPIE